jgi:hypothetical protein
MLAERRKLPFSNLAYISSGSPARESSTNLTILSQHVKNVPHKACLKDITVDPSI